jgi:hypothetical protein
MGRLCLVDDTPRIAWTIPVVQLIFDGYLTFLLCYKAYLESVAFKSLDYIPLVSYKLVLLRYSILGSANSCSPLSLC